MSRLPAAFVSVFIFIALTGLALGASFVEYSTGIGKPGFEDVSCAGSMCVGLSRGDNSATLVFFRVGSTHAKAVEVSGASPSRVEIKGFSWGYAVLIEPYIVAFDSSLQVLWVKECVDCGSISIGNVGDKIAVAFANAWGYTNPRSGVGIAIIDKSGSVSWKGLFRDTGEGTIDFVVANGNDYIAAGGFGDYHGYPLIVGFHGGSLWALSLSGESGKRIYITDVEAVPGGYILVGRYQYGWEGWQHHSFLMNIDTQGNVRWYRVFEETDFKKAVKSDGKILVLKHSKEFLGLVLVDPSNGDVTFSKGLIVPAMSYIYDMIRVPDGYAVVGAVYTGDFDGWGHHPAVFTLNKALECPECREMREYQPKVKKTVIAAKKVSLNRADRQYWDPKIRDASLGVSYRDVELETKVLLEPQTTTSPTTTTTTTTTPPKTGVVFHDPLDGSSKGTARAKYSSGYTGQCALLSRDDDHVTYSGNILPREKGTIVFYWKPPADLYELYSYRHEGWKDYGKYKPPAGGFLLDNIGWRAANHGSFYISLQPISWMNPEKPGQGISWNIWDGSKWHSAGYPTVSRPTLSAEAKENGVLLSWSSEKPLWLWDPNTWYQIAVNWGPKGQRLYINGRLVAEGDYTGPIDTSKDFSLGQNPGYWPYGPHSMHGCYDELTIYNDQIEPEGELTSPKIVGYVIYYDTKRGKRGHSIEVGNVDNYFLSLEPGTYYVSIAAKTETGFVGPPTEEIEVTVEATGTESGSVQPSTTSESAHTESSTTCQDCGSGVCGPASLIVPTLVVKAVFSIRKRR